MKIGLIIQQARLKKGLDIIDLAERLNILPGTVQNWESENGCPGEPRFELLCSTLDLNYKDLLVQLKAEKRDNLIRRYRDALAKPVGPAAPVKPPEPIKPVLRSREEREKIKDKGKVFIPGHQWCINCSKHFKFNCGYEHAVWAGNMKIEDLTEFYCKDCWPLHLEETGLRKRIG
jgi:transcriptional regulator with XRE-family HTH domain